MIMIHRRLVIMQQKAKPTNDLFDGCNLSAPLLTLVLVPFGECVNLLHHSVAHVSVAALLHTRQRSNNRTNNNPALTK